MKVLLKISFALLLLNSCENTTKSNIEGVYERVEIEKFKKLLKNDKVQLVDVRTRTEYEAGFIKNALNVDFLETNFIVECNEKLNKNRPLLIYCASGGRSAKAMQKLKEAGFTEIYELGVGYNGYH